MNKKLKEIPKFANEAEEREFWLTHDTTDYFDHSKSFRATPVTIGLNAYIKP